MKTLLIIPDCPRWATDFIADGIISSMPDDWKVDRQFAISLKIEKEYDVIYHMFWYWALNTGTIEPQFRREYPNSKILVGIQGFRHIGKTYNEVMGVVDGVQCNSKEQFKWLRHTHKNFHLTHVGTETDLFYPRTEPRKGRFRVGWCGNVNHYAKQCEVLNELDFPVLVHGRNLHLMKGGPNIRLDIRMVPHSIQMPEYLTRVDPPLPLNLPPRKDMKPSSWLPREWMVHFYHDIDCLVCTSILETGPINVHEACACGLPVVSTKVGIVPEMIEPEWIVNAFKPDEVAKEMNEKLSILKEDPELREQVGKRNREEIEKHWAWPAVIPEWVNFFESVL